jgi:hypothetical protein
MQLSRTYTEDGSIEHLALVHGPDVGEAQHFTPKLIERGFAEGWLSIVDGVIVLKTEKGEPDLEFRIVEAPGLFCAHCGERMNSGPEALEHIEDEHDGDESPDAQNPAGYRQDNYYRTEREA